MTERKFYKTVFTVEVLSEEPIEDVDAFTGLQDLHYMITEGDCLGRVTFISEKELTGVEMAAATYNICSEPGFFMLNWDGSDNEDCD